MASTSNTNGAVETTVSYEELIQLENEFDDVDNEIIRRQYELSAPLYKRRKGLAAQIPNFWPLVFEEAPGDIDRYIQPSDSQLFAECFKNFEVERFELDSQPRSFLLRFEFSPNKWFDDAILEKKFWMRRASDNWTGLVSEPVKISWKDGMDLTHGVTDAAVALWEAQQQKQSNGTAGKPERIVKQLPEYTALVKKLDSGEMSMPSFFTLFGFVSSKRYVSAEESEKANAAEADRRKRREKGETVEDPEEDELNSEEAEAMVCPYGDDMAYVLAEDVWPSAIKYFTAAQEQDDALISDDEFQSEESEEDSDDEAEVDIRALVKGKAQKRKEKSHSDADSPPPRSRQRRGN